MSLISIIIPYFKKKEFFEKTIHSVLNQTYSNFEIFIVYDDENKGDLDFVKKISELDSRINLIVNNQNLTFIEAPALAPPEVQVDLALVQQYEKELLAAQNALCIPDEDDDL